jgi:hypothetical protein
VHWAPGIPHALFRAEGFTQNSGASRREIAKLYFGCPSLRIQPSLRGAKRRSNPALCLRRYGLLRFARNDSLATNWLFEM